MYSSVISKKDITKNKSIALNKHAKNIIAAIAVDHRCNAGDNRLASNMLILIKIAAIAPIQIKNIAVIFIIL
jgi:hypothetical protein